MTRHRSTSPTQVLDDGIKRVLRERLLQQKQELLDMYTHDIRAGQEIADDPSEDLVDRANNAYTREFALSLSDGERQTLLLIEDALKRFEEDSYGVCTHCGRSIGAPRLQAVPWARYCVDCQEQSEQGLLSD